MLQRSLLYKRLDHKRRQGWGGLQDGSICCIAVCCASYLVSDIDRRSGRGSVKDDSTCCSASAHAGVCSSSACRCLLFERLDIDRRLGRGSLQVGTTCCTAQVAVQVTYTGQAEV
jgi:hypothetical protein